MAKKIIDNDNPISEAQVPVPETETALSEKEPKEMVETPEPKAEAKETKKPRVEMVTPDYADRLLKAYSNYPELYVDAQGGTFTVDTPPAFRSNATLYQNPYYKKP